MSNKSSTDSQDRKCCSAGSMFDIALEPCRFRIFAAILWMLKTLLFLNGNDVVKEILCTFQKFVFSSSIKVLAVQIASYGYV